MSVSKQFFDSNKCRIKFINIFVYVFFGAPAHETIA